jgi:hypothetical protein
MKLGIYTKKLTCCFNFFFVSPFLLPFVHDYTMCIFIYFFRLELFHLIYSEFFLSISLYNHHTLIPQMVKLYSNSISTDKVFFFLITIYNGIIFHFSLSTEKKQRAKRWPTRKQGDKKKHIHKHIQK